MWTKDIDGNWYLCAEKIEKQNFNTKSNFVWDKENDDWIIIKEGSSN